MNYLKMLRVRHFVLPILVLILANGIIAGLVVWPAFNYGSLTLGEMKTITLENDTPVAGHWYGEELFVSSFDQKLGKADDLIHRHYSSDRELLWIGRSQIRTGFVNAHFLGIYEGYINFGQSWRASLNAEDYIGQTHYSVIERFDRGGNSTDPLLVPFPRIPFAQPAALNTVFYATTNLVRVGDVAFVTQEIVLERGDSFIQHIAVAGIDLVTHTLMGHFFSKTLEPSLDNGITDRIRINLFEKEDRLILVESTSSNSLHQINVYERLDRGQLTLVQSLNIAANSSLRISGPHSYLVSDISKKKTIGWCKNRPEA